MRRIKELPKWAVLSIIILVGVGATIISYSQMKQCIFICSGRCYSVIGLGVAITLLYCLDLRESE